MPRRREIVKREVLPDPKYNDKLVARFINCIMRRGKKSVAEKILYGSFDIIKEKTSEDPIKVFMKAMDHIKPVLELKSRRVGGATYQIPIEVMPDRRLSLAMRWLATYAGKRGERTMMEKLAGEIMDAYGNKGGAVKKKEDTHKMAEANKAFAHFRW